MNIPALRKLDAMLMGFLDNFKDQNEFWYEKKNADDENADGGNDKCWLPVVKVPPDGFSDVPRKSIEFRRESVNQVLKAAMAINAQILMEMEIPDSYIEALPKARMLMKSLVIGGLEQSVELHWELLELEWCGATAVMAPPGSFDVTYMACLPNMVVMAPSDEAELFHMVATAAAINDRPSCFRYPRGKVLQFSYLQENVSSVLLRWRRVFILPNFVKYPVC